MTRTTELTVPVGDKKTTGVEPNLRTSADGYCFYLNDTHWKLNKDISIAVGWAVQLGPSISRSYWEVLAYYAETHSGDHAYNMNSRAKAYFQHSSDQVFSVNSLISYRSSLSKTNEHHLGAFRGFIRKWHELGYPGVGDEIIKLLDGWRLKGNEKGRSILSLDPVKGPLTDIEMLALTEGMLQAYIDERISSTDYALIAILMYSGRRPIQIVALKLKDIMHQKRDDSVRYLINFPRAKQRGVKFREQFTPYPIIEDLWILLERQKLEVIDRVTEIVGQALSNDLVRELPLFPAYGSFSDISLAALTESLKRDVHHAGRYSCRDALTRASLALDAHSERTGEPFHLFPKRFRETLGTNLAREGKGVFLIAEALDHSGLTDAGTYIKNLPDIVERIDKAVAMQLAPLAQAFQGVLIASERDATRNDPASRISSGKENLGNCGSYGFCGAPAPVACYTCAHFQPWIDGPHESVLDELIAKRDQVLADTGDAKIASSNDRLILAVSDVLNRCNQARASQSETNNG